MENNQIRVLQIMGIVSSGGVEAVILNYYRHIDRNRIQFDFIMHKGSNINYISEIKSMGANVYEITPYTKNVVKFTYEIYKIIKDGNYRIVHVNMNSLSGFPLLAAYLAGVKVRILHNHSTDSEAERLKTKVKRLLRPFAKIFANQYWACSKLAAKWMYGEKIVKSNKITVINNAIDLDKFAFNKEKRELLRKKLNLKDKFVVGHIGRFVPQKNHKFLVKIFSEIVKQRNDAVLLLVGEGYLFNKVRKEVEKLNLSNKVSFLGARTDVADLYNVMDVFVLPSLYEGLPVVGVECQANGLPILCSDSITNEVVISKAISLLPLSIGEKKWSYKTVLIGSGGRIDTRRDVVAAGYEINVEVKKIEKKYSSLFSC